MDKNSLQKSLIIRYIILALGVLFMIIPMIYMITSSLRPNSMTFSYPPQIFPKLSQLTLENYRYVLLRQNFFQYMSNTLIVAALSVLFSALAASMLGYCISRFKFWGRDFLYTVIITIMLIPGLAMLVPEFELAVTLKLVNNLWGVILFYTAWSIPFSTFLIKGYIDGIPKELDKPPIWMVVLYLQYFSG